MRRERYSEIFRPRTARQAFNEYCSRSRVFRTGRNKKCSQLDSKLIPFEVRIEPYYATLLIWPALKTPLGGLGGEAAEEYSGEACVLEKFGEAWGVSRVVGNEHSKEFEEKINFGPLLQKRENVFYPADHLIC